MSDEYFMSLALDQARKAAIRGEVPVGAVIVRNGLVIASGCNAPIGEHDPTAHAEIVALRAAALAMGNYRLDECEMFVTLEPCAMCSGAMLNARLKRVVFGATEPKTGAAGSVVNLFSLAQLNHQTVLQPDVMADESRLLLQDFFRQHRVAKRQAATQSYPLRDDALRTPDAAFSNLLEYPWRPNYVNDLPALEGLRLHYLDEQRLVEEGAVSTRLTYLCLHGLARWSYEFCRMIPGLLQAGHRVVAPDLIGFGKSDKPKKENFHRLNRHSQIVIELVEKLDLKNIVLVFSEEEVDWRRLMFPMSMSWRFQALRVMTSMENWVDLPFFASPQIRQQHVSDNFETNKVLSNAAWKAPFPDKGHAAALRAFTSIQADARRTDN